MGSMITLGSKCQNGVALQDIHWRPQKTKELLNVENGVSIEYLSEKLILAGLTNMDQAPNIILYKQSLSHSVVSNSL